MCHGWGDTGALCRCYLILCHSNTCTEHLKLENVGGLKTPVSVCLRWRSTVTLYTLKPAEIGDVTCKDISKPFILHPLCNVNVCILFTVITIATKNVISGHEAVFIFAPSPLMNTFSHFVIVSFTLGLPLALMCCHGYERSHPSQVWEERPTPLLPSFHQTLMVLQSAVAA